MGRRYIPIDTENALYLDLKYESDDRKVKTWTVSLLEKVTGDTVELGYVDKIHGRINALSLHWVRSLSQKKYKDNEHRTIRDAALFLYKEREKYAELRT